LLQTEEEFLAVLEKIKANGKYVPLVLGTNDQWEAATMGFQNIGPNYWHGEEGRLALIAGNIVRLGLIFFRSRRNFETLKHATFVG